MICIYVHFGSLRASRVLMCKSRAGRQGVRGQGEEVGADSTRDQWPMARVWQPELKPRTKAGSKPADRNEFAGSRHPGSSPGLT